MSNARCLVSLGFGAAGVTNVGATGLRVASSGAARFDRDHVALDGGSLSVPRAPEIDGLAAFTVEAVVTLRSLGARQTIAEAQTPPVALVVEADGTPIGSVYVGGAWRQVRGAARVAVGRAARLALLRDERGELSLELDGRVVGHAPAAGALQPTGAAGFRVGAGADGSSAPLRGALSEFAIRPTARGGAALAAEARRSQGLRAELARTLGARRFELFIEPDLVDHRFDRIRAMLAAVGVRDVSALSTLRIDAPLAVTPGMVLVARPRATPRVEIPLGGLGRVVFDGRLRPVGGSPLRRPTGPARPRPAAPVVRRVQVQRDLPAAAATDAARLLRTELARAQREPRTSMAAGAARVLQAGPDYTVLRSTVLPVHSALIVAGVLDLTDQTLRIEPTVETLYVIAEQVIGDTNAKITWRRPGGATPARADDPALNGQGWSGVHTVDGGETGLAGGDGRGGGDGLPGAAGLDAPNLEMWVKQMTALPDIDLDGEAGVKGGRGQRGGRGGNGATGGPGEWWWFFGAHCWSDPGSGGDGGDGGRGGRGGRGGAGGAGGDIRIGVLEGTLATTVTARAFRLTNDGGEPGRGGDGGAGGLGGRGGDRGAAHHDGEEVCSGGGRGHDGAQGQPGTSGADGARGGAGQISFFEFTQDAWDEQLTRPWLYELTPTQPFPGDTLVLKGSAFADSDRVVIGTTVLTPAALPDGTVSVAVPIGIRGGEHTALVRRASGVESNELRFWVRPWLEAAPATAAPGATVTLRGRAFLPGAGVLWNGELLPALSVSATEITATLPGTGGAGSAERAVSVAARNPDGRTSNTRTVTTPRVIENGIKVEVHGTSFGNFARGAPSWSTFEDTFGALEVWHEQLDPIFGHPILTAAFYAFYHHFLKGEDDGGLATGFCTSMSALVVDRFYTGQGEQTPTLTEDGTRSLLTAVHGRLLSRETLLDLHDQGRRGSANIETVFRQIEAALRDGASRETAPLLFFIPSGEVWDSGYFDKLASSHCVVPTRIVYPVGHDGATIEGCELYVWDCNHPYSAATAAEATNCRLTFRRVGGELRFDYLDGGAAAEFRSEDGITVGVMTNGQYYLSDHDLPFSGPLGLTRFVLDFLLSPADLQVEDAAGRRTGRFAGGLHAEIPDSHPAYLVPGLWLLPPEQALTRRIVGSGAGRYTYHSLSPGGVHLSLEGVQTHAGEVDTLEVSPDGSAIRLRSTAAKSATLTLSRLVGGEVRSVAISGVAAGPGGDVDVAVAADLSLISVRHPTGVSLSVRVFRGVADTLATALAERTGLAVNADQQLLVSVSDWAQLAVQMTTAPL